MAAVLMLSGGAGVSAHRYDEFLQAARLGVEPDRVRVEMSLTPGIAVADKVIGEVDTNSDGLLSGVEQQAYVRQVLHQFALRVDDSQSLRLTLEGYGFPEPAAMRNGDAAIELRLAADLPQLDGGAHRVTFRNDYDPAGSVYLANALVPASPELTITGQRRDVDQHELVIHFTLAGDGLSLREWGWTGFAGTLLLAAAWTRTSERRRRHAAFR